MANAQGSSTQTSEAAGNPETRLNSRILAFVAVSWLSLVLSYAAMLSVPIAVGRYVHRLLSVLGPMAPPQTTAMASSAAAAAAANATAAVSGGTAAIPSPVLHDAYAYLIGAYVTWAVLWIVNRCASRVQGRTIGELMKSTGNWAASAVACVCVWGLLVGAAPLALGILFDLAIWTPLRYRLDEIALMTYQHNWIVGAVLLKLAHRAVVFLAADADVREAPTSPLPAWAAVWRGKIARLERNGLERFEARWVFTEIVKPLLATMATALAVPYASAHFTGTAATKLASTYPEFFSPFALSPPTIAGMLRYSHAGVTGLCAICLLALHVPAGARTVHAAVRNDLYLVGRQLCNHE